MLEDSDGRAALQRLGGRSVPVVARGDDYVYAQVIADVAGFLKLEDAAAPELSPGELARRLEHILETAIRIVRAMPNAKLANELPNRPRTWRVLMHHVFQVPTAFLDTEESGEALTYEQLVVSPPDDLRTSADIADFGEVVRVRFEAWWGNARDEDFSREVATYFGSTNRHEMLERTVWHTAQHVRQVTSLLEQAGVTPDRPLTKDDVRSLPLTDMVWDDE